jgi:hypothetical protein
MCLPSTLLTHSLTHSLTHLGQLLALAALQPTEPMTI